MRYWMSLMSILLLLSCSPLSDRDTENNTAILENINKGLFKVGAEKHTEYLFSQIIEVYESAYPDAKVDVRYLEEKDLLNAILNDSVRIILLQRELQPNELEKIQKAHDTKPIQSTFAYDAIVLAQSRKKQAPPISFEQFKDLMEVGSDRIVTVEEHSNLYALALRMLDLKTSGKSLPTVSSLEDLQILLERDSTKIGILPFSLVSDEDDPKARTIRKMFSWTGFNITRDGTTETVFPSQSSIFTREWPLVKTYTILYCNVARKNGYGLVQFAHNSKVAKLILKAGLVPHKMPERLIQIEQ